MLLNLSEFFVAVIPKAHQTGNIPVLLWQPTLMVCYSRNKKNQNGVTSDVLLQVTSIRK